MTESGKGKVHAGDQSSAGGYRFENGTAGGDRFLLIDIKLDCNARLGELDGVGVHQITPDQQVLAFRFDGIGAVSRRVTVGRHGAKAGHQLGAV